MRGVCIGRDADFPLRPDYDGEVVTKWLAASVEPTPSRRQALDSDVDVEAVDGLDADTVNIGAPRRLIIRASVGTEDRKGDLIDPTGWDLEGYRLNPVFLWAHDRSVPRIGKASEVWVSNGALHAVVEFAPTDFASEIAALYERGFMRGVSVGFLPRDTELRPGSHGKRGIVYRRQELLEISAVPVPMHADALASRSQDGSSRAGLEVSDLRDELRSLREVASWLSEF